MKKVFENYSLDKLNEIEISEGSIEKIYESYIKEFPENERKDINHLKELMNRKSYKLIVANHIIFKEIIGYAFVYEIEKYNVLWLDYIAIEEKFQNSGYGTLLFNKIKAIIGINKIGMFMEIEIPENELQRKRERFYERLNAKKLDIHYQLPTADGNLDMNLFYLSITNDSTLSGEIIKNSILNVYKNIHSDINPKVLIERIEKEKFNDIYL